MAEKSDRRRKLEASLQEQPTDPFLRYGLAMQCLREGDLEEGRSLLLALIKDCPDEVAAYQQLGQSYMEEGDTENARLFFERGIARADALGDRKASNEMQGFLSTLD